MFKVIAIKINAIKPKSVETNTNVMIVISKCTAKEILLKITPISGITLHFMELLTFANIHLQNVFDPNQTYLIGPQQR